ncbi:hypothetical protein AB0L63_18500 [Nocardia sp. NPDC051990]|uniref:hypothetical protein n=1 Tax=Nocardia sp. NPDC051990 TaxID=3155285 RepID=UPI003415D379
MNPRRLRHGVSVPEIRWLNAVINALIGAGPHITDLTETEMLPWSRVTRTDNGRFRLPPTEPFLLL